MIPVLVVVEKNTSNAMEKSNKISVVIAIISDDEQRVLLTQRGKSQSFPLCWEFPGGKIEACESPELALKREMHEELGITINSYSLYHQFQYRYPSMLVDFYCYRVKSFEGTPALKESQLALNYQPIEKLNDLKFPDANNELIKMLQCEIQVSL